MKITKYEDAMVALDAVRQFVVDMPLEGPDYEVNRIAKQVLVLSHKSKSLDLACKMAMEEIGIAQCSM